MVKFWIAVASRQHVKKGEIGGFAQVCHGKSEPLKCMKQSDWIVYYSPTDVFGSKVPYQSFTAIGKIDEGEPYTFAMSDDFIPWRRNVLFQPSQEAPISPLIEKLSFIQDKRRWGFPFRRGCFEISLNDFQLIASAMGVSLYE